MPDNFSVVRMVDLCFFVNDIITKIFSETKMHQILLCRTLFRIEFGVRMCKCDGGSMSRLAER